MEYDNKQPQKKRHHYVPQTYLRSFCNEQGRVFVYRKDEPGRALALAPDATQFRRYYYSQPTPDGGQDNNQLEDAFGEIESEWPSAIAALSRRESINTHLDTIINFMSLQRVRVPAARDMAERMYAEVVKATAKILHRQGKLPTFPGSDVLMEKIEVSIDPHKSIHAMVAMLQGMDRLYKSIGLMVVHNDTVIPFLTSDNPVLWFDPTQPFECQKPYTVDLDKGAVLLLFPVSPSMLVIGSPEYLSDYRRYGLLDTSLSEQSFVEMVNAQVCRFAYEAVISSTPGQENLVTTFADVSPVLKTTTIVQDGVVSMMEQIFGERGHKPKWKGVDG